MADDVQLTDLEVIQRYSLAVRGATASREEVVQALESDLLWLTGDRRFGSANDPEAPPPPAARAGKAPVRKSAATKATTKRTAQA